MTTKRCSKCKRSKSFSEFSKGTAYQDGLHPYCRICLAKYSAIRSKRGLEILQGLAMTRGCCNHCQKPYTNEDWFFFEFDHIDPKLKQFKRETESRWVAAHLTEFFERVAPNLQLLCVKCHKIKTTKEIKLGGAVHQKTFAKSKPAEIIELNWNLFSQPPTLEDRETFSYHSKEGEWITVRDIDGKLISYEPYQKYLKEN